MIRFYPLRTKIRFKSRQQQQRSMMNFVKNALGLEKNDEISDLKKRKLFYPWDKSPYPAIRERAAKIKAFAKCPITHKDIRFTCPLSGIPTHHSYEAWKNDKEYHSTKKYEILKKVNLYEHDLRSGRQFPEFNFPKEQIQEALINMTNWDLFFYTRGFFSMDTEFQLAVSTKLLTYPITIGSILSHLSPYSLVPSGPITLDGLKSLAALRYTLYSPKNCITDTRNVNNFIIRGNNANKNFNDRYTTDKELIEETKPIRIFIVGARAESYLPYNVWEQLQFLLPKQPIKIIFVGPECFFDQSKKFTTTLSEPLEYKINSRLSLHYYTDWFHVYHKSQDFFPYDPYYDCFFCFHPGYSSMENMNNWLPETIPNLLETKCPVFFTGYHRQDMMNDVNILKSRFSEEMDILMEPVKNVFGSTKWELNDLNPHEVYQFNMYIAGYRGKRYPAVLTGTEFT